MEDECLVAMLLQDRLEALGWGVVGPAATVGEALDLLRAGPVDLAVLDVNLAGETVFPVADALSAADTPFVFATAYGGVAISARYAGRPVLEKPYTEAALSRALAAACTDRGR